MHWKAFASIRAVLPVDGADMKSTLGTFPLSKGSCLGVQHLHISIYLACPALSTLSATSLVSFDGVTRGSNDAKNTKYFAISINSSRAFCLLFVDYIANSLPICEPKLFAVSLRCLLGRQPMLTDVNFVCHYSPLA